MVCVTDDVITPAKFQTEIYRGYDYTGGRIFDFLLIDFCMGLTTVQCYCGTKSTTQRLTRNVTRVSYLRTSNHTASDKERDTSQLPEQRTSNLHVAVLSNSPLHQLSSSHTGQECLHHLTATTHHSMSRLNTALYHWMTLSLMIYICMCFWPECNISKYASNFFLPKTANFIQISYDFTVNIKSKLPHFMSHGRTDMVEIIMHTSSDSHPRRYDTVLKR